MGRLGRRSSKPPTTGGPMTPGSPKPGTSSPLPASKKLEYAADNVQRMPLLNGLSAIRASQRLARELSGRSGRSSTRLVSDAGMRPYVASLLGNAS